MQYDHKSEIYTFEIPRYVEGHDMTLCTKVVVHFNNIGADKTNEDIAVLTDLRLKPDDENAVICSWLIRREATQLAGILSILLQYICESEDGTVDYEWHTDIYSDIEVRAGRNNSAKAVLEYSNILAEWEERLIRKVSDLVTKKEFSQLKEDVVKQTRSQLEEITFDLLIQMEVAPVVLDYDGAVLTDADEAVLLSI